MLAYLARSLPLVVRAALPRDRGLVSRITRRVKLAEIDLNGHMNQASYAQVFELGRVDWFIGSGAWSAFRRQKVGAVVAEQRIVYRRELKPGQRYSIDTRAVRMEGRLLVFESLLLVGERVHAKAEVKLIFIARGGVLSAEDASSLCERYLVEPLAVEDWRVSA
jgi:acyl-CoA thioesterase FadM